MRRFGAYGLGGTGRFHHADVGLNAVEDTPNGRASGGRFADRRRPASDRRGAVRDAGGRRCGRCGGRLFATRMADARSTVRRYASRVRVAWLESIARARRRPARGCRRNDAGSASMAPCGSESDDHPRLRGSDRCCCNANGERSIGHPGDQSDPSALSAQWAQMGPCPDDQAPESSA
ncbi:hypothetical protein CO709_16200 [Burkholderia thailandensis]|nr:hypothetical protein CO709_16200 [Burkholderia thailandensis]